MKLLYLYSEIMGYNVPIIRILAENYCSEINVIKKKKKISNYQIEKLEKVNFFYKEDFRSLVHVDFMMGTHKWHGSAPNDEQLQKALDQLVGNEADY